MCVVVFGEAVFVVQFTQVAAERIRVDGLSLFGENQVIQADTIVFHDLVKKQLAQVIVYQLG